MSVLGVDVGGSACKAAAFRLDGTPIAAAAEEYALTRPRPGWLEFDPARQQAALWAAIRRVTADPAVRRDPVRALSISAAGEAVLPVDRHGRPLYNSIATPDPRGQERVPFWEERLGAARLFAITGQPLDGIYSLNRALWFRQFMPDLFAQTWKFLCWQELVLLWLGLPPLLDHTLASRTMAFDIQARDWSEEILALAEMTPEQWAPLVATGSVVGELVPGVAEELGLGGGVLVVAGGFDQCCAALGAGVAAPGLASIGTGSVEAIACAVDALPPLEPLRARNLTLACHAVAGLYLVTACSFAAGSLLRWYRDTLAGEERARAAAEGRDAFAVIEETIAPGPTDLLVLPHFAGAFAPERDPRGRGAILGLSLATSRGELLRALLEGTAFAARHIVEAMAECGLEIGELRTSGGGSRSPAWLRIKADVLGRPLLRMRVSDAGCLAGAMLAATALGAYRSVVDAAATMAQAVERITPEPETAAFYDRRFALYRRLYPTLAPLHHALGGGV